MQEKIIHHIAVGFLQTNCWIYPLENNSCSLIDPGDDAKRIVSFLEKLNLIPEYILLTHGHFDHTTAAPLIAAEYKNAKIAIHEADRFLLSSSFPVDLNLCEGDIIGSLTVLHLPGHSPGSIGLLDKNAGILFSGDTLFCGDHGRTDLPGGSETQLFASLKRLFVLDGNIVVYPGHDETTTIGAEKVKY